MNIMWTAWRTMPRTILTKSATCASAVRVLSVALVIVALPVNSFAALGGNVASVDTDRVRMQGALLRIVRVDAYTLHEVQSSSGTTIREYVSSGGTVFAVAWQGPWLPNLRQILGPYFDQYQNAVQAAQRSRRARGLLTISQPDLIVQMSGHPRAFSGRAYVPRLMPLSIQADIIR
jgi:hypothetical protein